MRQFMWGMLTMAGIVASVFFLKFWRVAGDRLFACFSCAFALLALSWISLAEVDPLIDARRYVYLPRLLAFLIILWGIFDKNRRSARHKLETSRLAGRQ